LFGDINNSRTLEELKKAEDLFEKVSRLFHLYEINSTNFEVSINQLFGGKPYLDKVLREVSLSNKKTTEAKLRIDPTEISLADEEIIAIESSINLEPSELYIENKSLIKEQREIINKQDESELIEYKTELVNWLNNLIDTMKKSYPYIQWNNLMKLYQLSDELKKVKSKSEVETIRLKLTELHNSILLTNYNLRKSKN
jgi:hypothetical protein